ncbi:MAG: hypothetical protein Q9214_001239 [Letrouitia sp. 1 TL-2023]
MNEQDVAQVNDGSKEPYVQLKSSRDGSEEISGNTKPTAPENFTQVSDGVLEHRPHTEVVSDGRDGSAEDNKPGSLLPLVEEYVTAQVDLVSDPHVRVELSSNKEDRLPGKRQRSIMREFLESGEEFLWPSEVGVTTDNHCVFHSHIQGVPLKFMRKISDGNAFIAEYEVNPTYPYKFKKSFIVKEVRASRPGERRKVAASEVNTMKHLRHPHIAALLGTYEHETRLNILIFPVARCDLDHFLQCTSANIRNPDQDVPKYVLRKILSGSDSTTSSQTSNSSSPHTTKSHQESKESQNTEVDYWPLDIPLSEKKVFLRRFFVCLCRALHYLHVQDVRHKDIKPANILIDRSGSVILTDFGISRRFAPNTSHITSNERKFTRKYASPEIIGSQTRDDPSDIFSLGCVFLEMATLLLDFDLSSLRKHCSHIVNDTGEEDAYHCNLEYAYTWMEHMRKKRKSLRAQVGSSGSSRDESSDTECDSVNGCEAVVESLVHIQKMLDEDPRKRPGSEDLWKSFQYISKHQCEDCDPRHPEAVKYQPSVKQAKSQENLPPLGPSSVPGHVGFPTMPSAQNKQVADGRANDTNSRPSSAKAKESTNMPSNATESDTTEDSATTVDSAANESEAEDILHAKRAKSQSLSPKKPSPHTQVIVYNFQRQEVYQGAFGMVQDVKHKVHPLPRWGQEVPILVDERAGLVATVNLGILGTITRVRRLAGAFDRIYIINYDIRS